jgi:hypothetical protein
MVGRNIRMGKKAAIKRHDFRDVREEARGGKGFLWFAIWG